MVIVSVNCALVAPAPVVPVRRTGVEPCVFGMPVMAPVPVLSESPGGNGSSAA
jgi:hypothetical protein